MTQPAPDPYLKSKVMTASPEQLRLMLFDGALKFCRQARHAVTQKDHEAMYNALVRAQKIVLEFNNSLDPNINPELTDKMTALYNYIYRRLVDAGLEQDAAAIEESIKLLEYERQTWQMLMNKAQAEKAGDVSVAGPGPIASIGPSDGAETGVREAAGGFSVEG